MRKSERATLGVVLLLALSCGGTILSACGDDESAPAPATAGGDDAGAGEDVAAPAVDAGTDGGPSSPWAAPALLEKSAREALMPAVAVDGDGNSVAVWIERDTAQWTTWGARYTRSTRTWSEPLLLSNAAQNASEPAVAMNAGGVAFASWIQGSDGSALEIWTNRYEPGVGWTGPVRMDADFGRRARIAVDVAGNAFVIWTSSTGVLARRFVRGTLTWEPAVTLEAGVAYDAKIGVADSGNAFAVWAGGGGPYDIKASHFTSGGSWDTAAPVDADVGHAIQPALGVTQSGAAVVAWRQQLGSATKIVAARRGATAGPWSAPSVLGDARDIGSAEGAPHLAVNASGRTIVVWTLEHEAMWSGFDAGAWSPAAPIGGGVLDVRDAHVAIDDAGNAFAVWRGTPAGGTTARARGWTSRFSSGAWGPRHPLDAPESFRVLNPRVAMNAAGQATAIWEQLDEGDESNIWASVHP